MARTAKAEIIEVGPRDGLQIEKQFVPTDVKIEIVNALFAAGIGRMEVTSFVSPHAVPQLRDAAEVVAAVKRRPGMRTVALVPNRKGAERAAAAGIDEVVLFLSASQSHNRSNLNRSIEESLAGFPDVIAIARDAGIMPRGAMAVAFGCPFEGDVAFDQILRICESLVEMGVQGLTLGDTTGMATPPLIEHHCSQLMERFPDIELTLHLHNTRGIGLVNVVTGLDVGVRSFESSVGGLGGCPYAPGASGNICTEDLVYLLDEIGVETGIDINAVIEVAKTLEAMLGRELPGQVMKAGPRTKRYSTNGWCQR